jgi:hypothetical protein
MFRRINKNGIFLDKTDADNSFDLMLERFLHRRPERGRRYTQRFAWFVSAIRCRSLEKASGLIVSTHFMDFTVLAVPVVVTGFMFVVRFLAGLEMFANGASVKPFLRFALVLFSLVGIASSSILTGEPVSPDGVSSLTWIA